jgi:CubicO group peptidase (beta-lactamase class C family)
VQMNMGKKDQVDRLLKKGVEEGIYPGAVLLVAYVGRIIVIREVGNCSIIPYTATMHRDTIFDLASLTKPLATTLAIMKLVDDATLDLNQPLADLLPGKLPDDKRRISLHQVLSHCAGFPDWKAFYLNLVKYRPGGRKKHIKNWICKEELVYQPGTACLYSDLGFMVLQWVIEEVTRMEMHQFLECNFYEPLSLKKTFLGGTSYSTRFEKVLFAATEDCPWRRRVIQGEVHDENAYALGGYSGHAGLFGTADEVYILVDLLREHYRGERKDYFNPQTVKSFFTRQEIADNCTWALGWDTPSSKNSSSGKYFSTRSVGHLGYTGTSVWLDLDRNLLVIFLTNRIHPTRNNEKIKAFRPRLHDLILEELGIAYS